MRGATIIFLFVASSVAATGCNPKGPTAAPPGKDWTHAELLAHLDKSRLKHTVEHRFGGSAFAPPSVRIRLDDAPGAVSIALEKDEQTAREKAGVGGDGAFAWGRFVFEGGKDRLALVRKALDGKLTEAEVLALRRKRDDDAAKAARDEAAAASLLLLANSYHAYADAKGEEIPFKEGERPPQGQPPRKGPPDADQWQKWARETKGQSEAAPLIDQCKAGGKFTFRWGVGVGLLARPALVAYENTDAPERLVVRSVAGYPNVTTMTQGDFAAVRHGK